MKQKMFKWMIHDEYSDTNSRIISSLVGAFWVAVIAIIVAELIRLAIYLIKLL